MLTRSNFPLALMLALAACGDDDSGGGQRPNPQQAAAAAAAKADDKNKLQPRKHVEDNVACPIPEKPTGPQCEPLAPMGSGSTGSAAGAPGGKMLADCEPGLYCIQVGTAYSCEPCGERDTIRHPFKERDFVADQSRDPFFNFVIMPVGVGTNSNNEKPEPHQSCKRADQFVAQNYSYQDLKLVGIVSQGTQRKVLMLDTAGHGNIIKRGDCVGKEKAVVKDIGAGYITFVVEEDADSKRPAQETSVPLHPNAIDADAPARVDPGPETTAPVVAPPSAGKPGTPGSVPPIATPPPPSRQPVQLVPPPKK